MSTPSVDRVADPLDAHKAATKYRCEPAHHWMRLVRRGHTVVDHLRPDRMVAVRAEVVEACFQRVPRIPALIGQVAARQARMTMRGRKNAAGSRR